MLAGPHDGTSALERSMDLAIADRSAPVRFVLPAGNGHLSRCHAEIDFGKYSTVSLPWRLQPDDLTSTQMEIWLPRHGESAPAPGDSRVSIRVETPFGMFSAPLNEQHGAAIQLKEKDEVLAEARYAFVGPPTNRGCFLINVQPTQRLRPTDPATLARRVAPSGLWKVHVTRTLLAQGQRLHAWIQRDDVVFGYPRRGRQSYFDASCYTRFDPISGRPVEDDHEEDAKVQPCHVKRRGLLNAIATGSETIVVGGVYRKELAIVPYSAGGSPTMSGCASSPSRDGPDALAVSDDSRVHEGVLAAGSRSGSTVAMSGTSVAAPQVTRLVASLLATSPHGGNRNAVRQLALEEDGEANGRRGAPPHQFRGGKGRIIRPGARLPRQ
jgi:hypothetical protein